MTLEKDGHSNRGKDSEPIAIIGSGCRFPGEASTPSKLWEILREPRDLLMEIPADRFSSQGFYHPNGQHHGTSNVKSSYFLTENCREFDAHFFGIKPVEANAIDPQQRLLLETVYEAIEAAGMNIEQLQGSNTGVFVGIMCGDYGDLLIRDTEQMPTYQGTGTGRSIVSNRISYFFDWNGPSMTIDTACSSSLVALHQAVQLLRSREAGIAVVGGSNLILGPELYIAESKLNMLSPDGRSRMWDISANGYARGEGVAAVILKKLSAALEDGDHIECIIRETGINQDGRTKGITMPSAISQASLIRETYAKAGLDLRRNSDRCQYFEAHGTGTPAGDPIEAEAIQRAFYDGDIDDHDTIYVGSVKTVIGHTEGTAGLAAILKTSLALQHSVIPPNLLFDKLSPAVEPFYSGLEVPTAAKPWPNLPEGTPRRASVNCFGFGGTNAHAILEHYENLKDKTTEKAAAPSDQVLRKPRAVFIPFVFSAASESALTSMLAAYVVYLKTQPGINPRDLAWTLQSRSILPVKAAFSALTIDVLCKKIDDWLGASKMHIGATIGPRSLGSSAPHSPRVLGVFTGQGAQWAGMGRGLLSESQCARKSIQHLENTLAKLPAPDRPAWSLMKELLADASTSRINEASLSQPLCTAVQLVLVDMLRSAGFQFQAVVGHSSGEIAAAYAAGLISATDAIRIAYYRGLHTKLADGSRGQPGAMLAVGTSLQDANELRQLSDLEILVTVAACNSPSSVTLSGDADAIEELKVVFEDEGKFTRSLMVDKAYHSHHMIPCSTPYAESLKGCDIQPYPRSRSICSWFSSVAGKENFTLRPISSGDPPLHDEEIYKELKGSYWIDNMVNPVHFSQAIERASAADGPFDLAIEIGPHSALKLPTTQTIHEIYGYDIPYVGVMKRGVHDIEAFADGLALLWNQASQIKMKFQNYDELFSGEMQRRVLKDLPTYAWEHNREFWHETRLSKAFRTRAGPPHVLLGNICPDGVTQHRRWRNFLSPKEIKWLTGHKLQGQIVFPAAGYVVAALEASKTLAGHADVRLIEMSDFVIHQAMAFDDDDSSIEVLCTLTDISHHSEGVVLAYFKYFSALGKGADVLKIMASCNIKVMLGSHLADALPPRLPQAPNMIAVDADAFYSFLVEFGYEYQGPFRALSLMKRKLGLATGFVRADAKNTSDKVLMIHPGMLDAAIQSVILAYGYPHDGSLWSLHVPTSIRRIVVNPSLCTFNSNEGGRYAFDTYLTDKAFAVSGDVEIFPEATQNAMIQMEGIQCAPFSAATSADDTLLFSKMIWDVAVPSGNAVAWDGSATSQDYDLAYVLERVSYFYLRKINTQIPIEHTARRGPYKSYFVFVSHTCNLVSSGRHKYAKKEWEEDSLDQILEMSNRYPDVLDLKLIHVVGKHMAAAVRGETTILEHMMQNNLLNRFYKSVFPPYMRYLGRMVSQLAHRYPRMNILEIGAGTGGATKHILDEIGYTFSTYTFTDISSGFFDTAREDFRPYGDKMSFRPLDIEKNPSTQGFNNQSYDLIIASFVLHATSKLERTMRNVRSLLRPGGYLLMLDITDNAPMRSGAIFGALPGWWLGVDDGRVLSPCIEPAKWDALLRATGFSGIDTITADADPLVFPVSLIASQSVDEKVAFLRQPLVAPAETTRLAIPDLVLVGGSTPMTSQLMNELIGLLGSRTSRITRFDSLKAFCESETGSTTTVLSLADIDDPIFKELTVEKFESAKKFFNNTKTILWVTSGRRADCPHANMTVGFGRSLMREIPDLRIQFLDIDRPKTADAHFLANTLLQFQAAIVWEEEGLLRDLLWSVEPELVLEDDRLFIPRLVQNEEQNDRYNSSRRVILHKSSTNNSNIAIVQHHANYFLKDAHELKTPEDFESNDFSVVHVSHSKLQPLPSSQNCGLFVIVGKLVESEVQVIGLSKTHTSTSQVPNAFLTACTIPYGLESRLIEIFASNLLVLHLLKKWPRGSTILVHEPTPLLYDTLSRRCTACGIKLIFTTTQAKSKGSRWLYLHPHASERFIKQILPVDLSGFLNFSTERTVSAISLALRPECEQISMAGSDNGDFTTNINYSSTLVKAASLISLEDLHGGDGTSYADVVPLKNLLAGKNINPSNSVVEWTGIHRLPILIEPVDSRLLFRNDRTYWLSGLTGTLGLSLCEWMIHHGAKHIALTSRKPKIDKAWIHTMRRLGATVEVFPNDVSNKSDLLRVYGDIRRTLPPIAGVAHGAMVLRDALVRNMSFDDMMSVLRPKVDGSINLDELFSDKSLDFMIFFSSMASIVGNMGQTNYGAANEFMMSLAVQRRKRGLAASVINIGAVIGVGYVNREVKQRGQDNLVKLGYTWMSERDVHQAFAEAVLAAPVDSGRPADVYTGVFRHISVKETYKPVWFNNPMFGHRISQDSTTQVGRPDDTLDIPLKARIASVANQGEAYQLVQDAFILKLQTMLQSDSLGDTRSILLLSTDDIGVDSLIAVEIRSWFLKHLSVNMPVLKILGGETIGTLLDYALQNLSDDVFPKASSVALKSEDAVLA